MCARKLFNVVLLCKICAMCNLDRNYHYMQRTVKVESVYIYMYIWYVNVFIIARARCTNCEVKEVCYGTLFNLPCFLEDNWSFVRISSCGTQRDIEPRARDSQLLLGLVFFFF